jgi:hypothetical protein
VPLEVAGPREDPSVVELDLRQLREEEVFGLLKVDLSFTEEEIDRVTEASAVLIAYSLADERA